MDFYIDSDVGRIGPFWWFNTDPKPMTLMYSGETETRQLSFMRFGTCGFGDQPYVVLTPLEPIPD